MLGALFLLSTLFFYACLLYLTRRPMPGGDYGVGYSYAWLIYVAGLGISAGLLAWNLYANHSFDWLSPTLQPYSSGLVAVGWLSWSLAVVWALDYRSQRAKNTSRQWANVLALSRIHLWLPLLMLLPAWYLLQALPASSAVPVWVTLLIQIGFFVSIAIALIFLGLWGKLWLRRQVGKWSSRGSWLAERRAAYQASLEHIQNYQEATIVGLLKYAHPKNDRRQREAATAKIKSFAHWEADLVVILGRKDLAQVYVFEDPTYYAYAFLTANAIEHPEQFIQPIQSSIQVITNRVKRSLADPYNLELSRIGVEMLCQALEQRFKTHSAAFRPAMLHLQAALSVEPPERKNKQHHRSHHKNWQQCRRLVDAWLASHD
jgi:hypothetical protein